MNLGPGMLIDCLAWIQLSWYTIMLSMAFGGSTITFRRFRLAPKPKPDHPRKPRPTTSVSILRPLCGLDPNLEPNLESAFVQQWPADKLEILLCVANEHDPAIPIAQAVIRKYPAVNARLLIGEENVGVNPKINNLMPAYRAATSDLLWILDSNILIQPGTLARAVAAFEPVNRPIGLVHHLPVARLPSSTHRGIGSVLEYCFMNGNHARQYVAINSAAIESCLVGKSNLFFKSDLERATRLRFNSNATSLTSSTKKQVVGLECFGQYLSEDNMIGKTIWDTLDLRHALAPDQVYNIVDEMNLAGYCRRRVRWIRVRKYMCFLPTLAEPFTESILLGLLTTASLNHLLTSTNFPILRFFLGHLFLYFLLDYNVLRSLEPEPELGILAYAVGWLAREILAFPIWAFAFLGGDQVQWRHKERFQVKRDGGAVRLDSSSCDK